MKKIFKCKTGFYLLAGIMFSVSSFALTLKPGDYRGHTDKNEECSLFLRQDGAIGLFYEGAFDAILFHPKKINLDGNTLMVSGSSDFAVGKTKNLLSNDGTPIEALMGVGPLIKIAYDVNCKNLILK